ncbi:MAG: DUF1282 domain-containing protein [Alphaproteobacteria bacterium]|nr:DUF1282 domain-containing protein [Alphaproteobacteria bacterium]
MATDEDDAAPPPRGRKGRRAKAGAGAKAAQARAEIIFTRALGLMVKPDAEWVEIREERTNPASLLLGYVAPLAAIPPVFGFIGQAAFGERIGEQIVRTDMGQALIQAVLSFAMSVGLIYFLGMLINALAEQFEADRDEMQALKVAAYSPTPAFLSGVFALWPQVWWIGLIGVGMSAYLLLRGLPVLMRTPPDRALGYAATAMIAALIAFVVAFMMAGCLTGVGRVAA